MFCSLPRAYKLLACIESFHAVLHVHMHSFDAPIWRISCGYFEPPCADSSFGTQYKKYITGP
jgi:hypothetical protein